MKYIIVQILLITLFATLTFCQQINQSLEKTFLSYPTNSNYNYYVLAQEWPATVCLTQKCTPQYMLNYNPKSFNMHGLWPSGTSTGACNYPSNCLSDKYDQSLIYSSIVDWMNTYWIGIYSSEVQFRAHEYEKHGSCYDSTTTDLKTQENLFFGQVQKVQAQYNLVNALSQSQIIPSNTATYTGQQITDAVKKAFGQTTVNIQCQVINGVNYLNTIQLSLGLDFGAIINPCDPYPKSCGMTTAIKYPVYVPVQ